MGMGYHFELVGGDSIVTATGIRFSGVQMRNESTGHVWPIIERNFQEKLIAIRIPSGKVWSGTGHPFRYVPPEVVIIRLDLKTNEANPIMHVPVGREQKRS